MTKIGLARATTVLAAAAALMAPAAAQADATFDVNAEGMKSMPLTAWGLGAARPTSAYAGTGGAGGSAKFEDVWFTKLIDENSPKLFKVTMTGLHASTAAITVTKAGKQTMKYCFRDVMFTGFENTGSGSATPTEKVSFNFGAVTLSYTPYSMVGSPLSPIKFGWNAIGNLTGDYVC